MPHGILVSNFRSRKELYTYNTIITVAKLENGALWRELPFYAGFRLCCDDALYSCGEDIITFLKREKEVDSDPLSADPETVSHVQIFVGPSGCGKTSKIHALLKKHWGLYLLPGNLPKTTDEVGLQGRLQYKPRGGGGSRDTQTWVDDAKSISEFGAPSDRHAIHRAFVVLMARIWILEQFRIIGPNRTPGDWLKLQIDCKEKQNDIFNRLYRVRRFPGRRIPKVSNVLCTKLIFCFDEAQCDLKALPPGEIKWPKQKFLSEETFRFQPLRHMISATFMLKFFFGNSKNVEICLSGTALQFHDIQRMIESETDRLRPLVILWPEDYINAHLDHPPKINRKFYLIENEEDFRNLTRARGYRYDDEELASMIIKHSKPLYGRIVWSVCYLDEIHKLIHRPGGDHTMVLDEDIKEASVKVYEVAKEGLIERLKDMRRRRVTDERLRLHEELIDELCSLAIRSDLLGESTIFRSSESMDLVAFGFGFLEEPQGSDVSQVRLKERVAVDAAIEYFQGQRLSNGQSEYDRALVSFLYDQQSNASALGKVAELFFAWVSSWTCLSIPMKYPLT